MFCVSINYKNADVDIRKEFAFSSEMQLEFSKELIKNGNISQCIMLCTCNRTEIYFCGNSNSLNDVEKMLAEYSKIDFMRYIRIFQDDKAINHLFKVACGIESMVVGEDEILGQTKNAYQFAKDNNTVSYELNMIFQSAITCAKKIKTNTELSRTSVSVATLTANEVSKFKEKVQVLIIGATGKIGSTVLKNLISHKNIDVTATSRSHNAEFKISGIKTIDYEKRYEFINNFDCIVSATSSPHYTITAKETEKYIDDKKERLFIDLAVPPDIDLNLSRTDNIKLIGIDYFEKLARENNILKLDSVELAKQIIFAEIENLKKELAFHEFLPMIDEVKNIISRKSLEDLLYKFKSDLNSENFSAVLEILKSYRK